jgi:hypothetical protein
VNSRWKLNFDSFALAPEVTHFGVGFVARSGLKNPRSRSRGELVVLDRKQQFN